MTSLWDHTGNTNTITPLCKQIYNPSQNAFYLMFSCKKFIRRQANIDILLFTKMTP